MSKKVKAYLESTKALRSRAISAARRGDLQTAYAWAVDAQAKAQSRLLNLFWYDEMDLVTRRYPKGTIPAKVVAARRLQQIHREMDRILSLDPTSKPYPEK